jgi:flagellar motor switch protein FliN
MSAEPTTPSPSRPAAPQEPRDGDSNLALLLDVPLDFSAELGSCVLSIQQVLQLTRGKVIELDKLAGEPLDIRVNGRLIAHGEAVVVNERFGVRVVDIASPAERLARMRS